MKSQIRYLQELFYDLLNDYGKVYILVKYSEKTVIGNRGFTDEEKKQGLILVFNQRNYKNLQWEDDGSIITKLGFGVSNRQEKCFLHSDDIISVFSPDAKVRFDRWDVWDIPELVQKEEKPSEKEPEEYEQQKIVSLEQFRKTRT
jgi:hypothetical protein